MGGLNDWKQHLYGSSVLHSEISDHSAVSPVCTVCVLYYLRVYAQPCLSDEKVVVS